MSTTSATPDAPENAIKEREDERQAAEEAAPADEQPQTAARKAKKNPASSTPAKADEPGDATKLPEDQPVRDDTAAPGVTPEQLRDDSNAYADKVIAGLEGRRLHPEAAHRIINAVRDIKV